MYFSNKIIDKCLQLTYDWDRFNKLYRQFIKISYIPILSFITNLYTGYRLYPRHSINSDDFKAFGSDVDLTIVGELENINKWRYLHTWIKFFNKRLGEWEFYTDYEFQVLVELQKHKYDKFWNYLCSLRKPFWIRNGFKPGQEFKKEKALQRMVRDVADFESEYIRELLIELIGYEQQVKRSLEAFETDSSYLQFKLGNTADSTIKFQDYNLYQTFIDLLPSAHSLAVKDTKNLELKNYLFIREVLLTLASMRYNNPSNQERLIIKKWINDLISFINRNDSVCFIGIDIKEFSKKILYDK